MRRRGSMGCSGIFDDGPALSAKASEDALPRAPEWDEHTRLQNEKDVLGFFVSGHPMDKYREKLRNMKVIDTADGMRDEAGAAGSGGARVKSRRTRSRLRV